MSLSPVSMPRRNLPVGVVAFSQCTPPCIDIVLRSLKCLCVEFLPVWEDTPIIPASRFPADMHSFDAIDVSLLTFSRSLPVTVSSFEPFL